MTSGPGGLADRSRPHAVYRIWDERDRLVYIGCSVHPTVRLGQHRAQFASTWGREKLTMVEEWHPDYQSGRAAETAAIIAEKPLYNSQHHPDRPQGAHRNRERPPHEDWELVWCGPDDPPWVRRRYEPVVF